MKFYIYEDSLLSDENRQEVIIQLQNKGLKYSDKIEDIEYLFIFGGDGTFLKALKKFINLDIKVILVNTGRLGFLSSSSSYLDYNLESYQNLDYLEIKVDNAKFDCINELIINCDQMKNIEFYINDEKFKSLISSQINVVNNLGTTGINRSNIKPLVFPWNHQYIIDVKNEPIYNYYKPLLQPIVLSNSDKTTFKFDDLILNNLKIDNNKIYDNQIIKEISITQKKSKCLILNLNNKKSFFDKLNNLF